MKSSTKMIALVALVCAAPFVSAWIAYYVIKPTPAKSYGELLETRPLIPLEVSAELARKWDGKWRMVMLIPEPCLKECLDTLFATRQARTMLGRERDRVVRIALTPGRVEASLAAEHADLIMIPPATRLQEPWREALGRGILLVDPLGNQVILWPRTPDIKKLNQDLSRLLRASRIG